MKKKIYLALVGFFLIMGISQVGSNTDMDQVNKILASDGAASDWFGNSVSISGDYAIVGAPMDDDLGSASGSAYIFHKNATGQYDQVNKILASDGGENNTFGYSVSISGDYAIVGAKNTSVGSSIGAAYIFHKNATGQYEQVNKLLASDGVANDSFGYSVSISGDYAIVGAYWDDDLGSASGSAYIFHKNATGQYDQVNKLLASTGATSDFFGSSVSISGDYAIIGSSGDNTGGAAGSAYIFHKNATGQYEQVNRIVPSNAVQGSEFGWSVSISGDEAIVGDSLEDNQGIAFGAAYIFHKNATGQYEQMDRLLSSDGASSDWFGYSVSISGDYAVIGAEGDDYLGSMSGSVYIFRKNVTGRYEQVNKLLASDGEASNRFGYSVSISEGYAIFGSVADNDSGTNSGSAYIFQKDTVIVESVTSPSLVYTNTDFKINLTITDPDAGDTLKGYVQFYKNDAPIGTWQSTTVTNGTNTQVGILLYGNYTLEDNLTAEVWAGDGAENTTKVNLTSVTVQTLRPTIVSMRTFPSRVYPDQDIKVNLTVTDPNVGDTLTGYVQFYKNNAKVGGEYSTTVTNNTNTQVGILLLGNYTLGDFLIAEVWAGDGAENTTKINFTAEVMSRDVRPNYYNETIGQSTNTSTSPKNQTLLTFTPEDNSTYLILSSWLMQQSSASYATRVNLTRLSGTPRVFNTLFYRPKDATDYISGGTIGIDSFGDSPGSQTYAVQYSSSNSAGTARIKETKIIALKLNDYDKYNETEGRITTTDTNYANVTNLTFTPVTEGEYIILASATMDGSSSSYDFKTQLLIDGANYSTQNVEPPYAGNKYSWVAVKKVSFTAVSHTINIQYSSENAGATTGISDARIVALRADKFKSNYYNESELKYTVSTSYVNQTTLDFTPSEGDHLILGGEGLNGASTSYSTYGTLVRGATSYGTMIFEPQDASTEGMSFFTFKKENLSSDATFANAMVAAESSSATSGAKNGRIVVLELMNGNTAPSIVANVTSPPTVYTSSNFQVNLTIVDADVGQTLTGYVQFYVNATPVLGIYSATAEESTNTLIATLLSGNFSVVGSNITAEVWAGDGITNSTKTNLTNVTVQNSVPTIIANATSPSTVFTTTDWKVNLTVVGDGTLTGYVQFYKNDAPIGTWQSTAVTNNTNTQVGILLQGNYTLGDVLIAEVWAGDGSDNSTKINLTNTVQAPPETTTPFITPSSPFVNDSLVCSFNVTGDNPLMIWGLHVRPSTLNMYHVFCDSDFCYGAHSSGYLSKTWILNGTVLWGTTVQPSTSDMESLFCDTDFCYGAHHNGNITKTWKINGTILWGTGAQSVQPSQYFLWGITCDSDFCYGAHGGGYLSKTWKDNGTVIWSTGVQPNVHTMFGISCDTDFCYGAHYSGYLSKTWKTNGTVVWGTGVQPNYGDMNAIYCDSDFCFGAHNNGWVTKTWKNNGTILWGVMAQLVRPSEGNMFGISCDTDYCYGAHTGGDLSKIWKINGTSLFLNAYPNGNAMNGLFCDTDYCYGAHTGGYLSKVKKEGKNLVAYVNWYKNGELNQSTSAGILINNTNVSISYAGAKAKGENWSCGVIPGYDNEVNGTLVNSSNVTIQNSAPIVTAAFFYPSILYSNLNSKIYLILNEPNGGDTLKGYVQFYKNNAPIGTWQSTTVTNNTNTQVAILLYGNYTVGDVITAEIWTGDSLDNSTKVNLTSKTVQTPSTNIITMNNYLDAGHKAYEKGDAAPTSPFNYDAEATMANYLNLSVDDNAYWNTSLANNTNEYDSQIFHFNVSSLPFSNLQIFNTSWKGKSSEVRENYDLSLYIWNVSGSAWVLLNTDSDGSVSEVNWTNQTQVSNFINQTANGNYTYIYSRFEKYADLSSCPFIYSWNGSDYSFDSEAITAFGTIKENEGKQPSKLPSLKSENGTFKLKVKEQLTETSYIDSVELLKVNHSPDTEIYSGFKPEAIKGYPQFLGTDIPVQVVKTYKGSYNRLVEVLNSNSISDTFKLYTLKNQTKPINVTENGEEVKELLEIDNIFWNEDLKNLDLTDENKDLILDASGPEGIYRSVEFIYPFEQNKTQAKLKIRIKESDGMAWVSSVMLQNSKRLDAYDAKTFMEYAIREASYKISVWDGERWVNDVFINDYPREKASEVVVPLDIKGISTESLKVRVLVNSNVLLLDGAYIDYSDDEEISIERVPLKKAVKDGEEITDILATSNGGRIALTIGEEMDLEFNGENDNATFFLNMKGYYIGNEISDAPRVEDKETIERIFNEPGFSPRYWQLKYLSFKNNLSKKHNTLYTDYVELRLRFPPNITSNVTSPTTVYNNTDWKINLTVTNQENAILTGYVQFYKNDVGVGTWQSTTVTNNTNTQVAILLYGNYTLGDNLTAEVWAGNGAMNTTKVNLTAVTVQVQSGQCSPTSNVNWTIIDAQVCDGVNLNIGSGSILINPLGNLTLIGSSNVTASGLEIRRTGDCVFVYANSKINVY